MKIAIITNAKYVESEVKARERFFESKASKGTTIRMFFPERYGISVDKAPSPEELTGLAIDVVARAKEGRGRASTPWWSTTLTTPDSTRR